MNAHHELSYLDDRALMMYGAPRRTRHYYALTLRELGEPVEAKSENATAWRFDVNRAEADEFPELYGVKTVVIEETSAPRRIIGRIETPYYAICEMNGPDVHFVNTHYDSIPEAQRSLGVLLESDVAGLFLTSPADPWVASMLQPMERLTR
jgi:hypothetical protein